MAHFTERPPTSRELRRAIVVVFEQTSVPPSETASGLDLVERVLIAHLQGSRKIVATLIDWTGRVYEEREFPTVDAAKAFYRATSDE